MVIELLDAGFCWLPLSLKISINYLGIFVGYTHRMGIAEVAGVGGVGGVGGASETNNRHAGQAAPPQSILFWSQMPLLPIF